MNSILGFIKQPSTLRGLAAIAGAFGLAFTDIQIDALIAAVIAAVGAVEVFIVNDDA